MNPHLPPRPQFEFTSIPEPQSPDLSQPVIGDVVFPTDNTAQVEPVHPDDRPESAAQMGDVEYPETPALAEPAEPPAAADGPNTPPGPPGPPAPPEGTTPDEPEGPGKPPGSTSRVFDIDRYGEVIPPYRETLEGSSTIVHSAITALGRDRAFVDTHTLHDGSVIQTIELECATPNGLVLTTVGTDEYGHVNTIVNPTLFEPGADDIEMEHSYKTDGRALACSSSATEMLSANDPEPGTVTESEISRRAIQRHINESENRELMDEYGLGVRLVGAQEAADIAHFVEHGTPRIKTAAYLLNRAFKRIDGGDPVSEEDAQASAGIFDQHVRSYLADNPLNVDGGRDKLGHDFTADGHKIGITVGMRHEDPDNWLRTLVDGTPWHGPQGTVYPLEIPYVQVSHTFAPEPEMKAELIRSVEFDDPADVERALMRDSLEYAVVGGELQVTYEFTVVIDGRTVTVVERERFRGDRLEANSVRNFIRNPHYRHPLVDKFKRDQEDEE
jgi:hypothetical protein